MVTEELIQRLEALYQNLLTKDPTPDEEAAAKAQLIDILSSIKASAEMQAGAPAKNLVNQANAIKDILIAWDPYGSAWFKEEKALVDGVSSILGSAKALKTQKAAEADSAAITALKEQIEELASSFNAQIANLNNEIASIKKSVIALATAMKNKFASSPAPQEVVKPSVPAVEQKPVSLNMAPAAEISISPKPVLVPREDPKKVMAKPISIPKPIPISLDEESETQVSPLKPFQNVPQQPIPIPFPIPKQSEKQATKPEQKPKAKPSQPQAVKPVLKPIPVKESSGPTPIPLSGEDFEEPIPLDEAEAGSEEPAVLGTLSSSSKEKMKKQNKEQLFSLLSSSPAGAPELGVDTSQEPSSSASEDLTVSKEASADPETLYQELISLEGKRYSIERSIRDLKADRENGVLNDTEYKDKISQLLNKLQTISKRIEEIRKKLD